MWSCKKQVDMIKHYNNAEQVPGSDSPHHTPLVSSSKPGDNSSLMCECFSLQLNGVSV